MSVPKKILPIISSNLSRKCNPETGHRVMSLPLNPGNLSPPCLGPVLSLMGCAVEWHGVFLAHTQVPPPVILNSALARSLEVLAGNRPGAVISTVPSASVCPSFEMR